MLLKEIRKVAYLFGETSDTIDSWIINSGATNHVYNSLHGFIKTRNLGKGELNLQFGMRVSITNIAVGDVKIYFEYLKFFVLKDCYYIPNFTRNLISIGFLKRQCYYISLDDPVFISFNNKIIFCG